MATLKEQAALAAADLVESGMCVGLGTGSTSALLVRELGRRVADGRLRKLRGLPTSEATARLAGEVGIPLVSFDEVTRLDLSLDGADEVDPDWNLIKGAGGALLREKIVAQASARRVIMIDESKLVAKLGSKYHLPIEVISFGWKSHDAWLRSLGGVPTIRKNLDGSISATDQRNYILDVDLKSDAGQKALADPTAFQSLVKARAGVVETGLFLGITEILVVARLTGVEVLRH